ncbi:MAG: hypothetical protein AAFQ79_09210 [Pseudomonadota bacterium]
MDVVFAHAISQITNLPLDMQRKIGQALLVGSSEPDLPVIEFGEPGAGEVEQEGMHRL